MTSNGSLDNLFLVFCMIKLRDFITTLLAVTLFAIFIFYCIMEVFQWF